MLRRALLATVAAAATVAATTAVPAPPRTFAADGLLEFTYPIASPRLASLDVNQERDSNGSVETLHRTVTMRADGALGPGTVPHPELLAHGPLTTYFQPLDGACASHKRQPHAVATATATAARARA
eukprot:SAG11_NODE_13166_length_667_cov_0.746479_1_plen_126_part_00